MTPEKIIPQKTNANGKNLNKVIHIVTNRIRQSLISKERIDAVPSPRRICFGTSHKGSLKRVEGAQWIGTFSVPFLESFYPLFYKLTELELFPSRQYGTYWRSIRSEDEYEKISAFIKQEKNTVFLRDTLALSIALCEYMREDGESRTELGELEYRAKYHGDEHAFQLLVECCIDIINRLPFYNEVKTFCAVPSSNNIELNLPTMIVRSIERTKSVEDLSRQLKWENPKEPLKDLEREERWEALLEANLKVDADLTGKTLILIDDLYQSGSTMQYLAMKLQQAGTDKILGLALVKSRRDTDNV